MDTTQQAFHLEEYKQLRTEVSGLLARIELLFRYSIIVAATVFAWLLSNSLGAASATQACLKLPGALAQLGWLIPPTFILFAGLMAAIAIYRVNQMGEYLLRIEQALGQSLLGWEAFMKPQPRVLTWSTGIIWVLLFACSVGSAVVGSSATSAASTVCRSAEAK